MSLPPETAATAGICRQLVLTADSGLRSVMRVPGQRSTTERATAGPVRRPGPRCFSSSRKAAGARSNYTDTSSAAMAAKEEANRKARPCQSKQ